MKLTVADDRRCLQRDGKPFFWLADTLWSAFTNMTDEELESYLILRRQQGFNVLQINILPQWDRCWTPAPCMPWPCKADGMFDYSAPMNQDYFDHAAHMCEKITAYGFTPALVVLWSNYVPGTWASGMVSGNILPEALVGPYCRKVAETFARFDPVYILSGDTDLDTPESAACYEKVLYTMRGLCPDALLTLHIRGRYTYLPNTLAQGVDFYLYQSGHNAGYPEKCYTMPGEMLAAYPQKPILNSEPCYEQMGYSGNKYGRFSAREVRRAAWMSVLSGACAGVTYGAHGVWNWVKPGMPANPVGGEGFDAAKPWTEAMQFPGAWDYGWLKQLLEDHGVTALLPDDRVANVIKGVRHVKAPDGRAGTHHLSQHRDPHGLHPGRPPEPAVCPLQYLRAAERGLDRRPHYGGGPGHPPHRPPGGAVWGRYHPHRDLPLCRGYPDPGPTINRKRDCVCDPSNWPTPLPGAASFRRPTP